MWSAGGLFIPPLVIGMTRSRPDVQRWLFSSSKPSSFRLFTVMLFASVAGEFIGSYIGRTNIARTVKTFDAGFAQRYSAYQPPTKIAVKIPQNTKPWPTQSASPPDPLPQDIQFQFSNTDMSTQPPLSRWEEIRHEISKESFHNQNAPVSNLDYPYEPPKSTPSNSSTTSQSLAQKEFDALLESERKMADQEFS